MTNNAFADDINKHSRANRNTNHDGSFTENQPNDCNDNNSPLLRWTFPFGKPKLSPTNHIRCRIESQVKEYGEQIGISQHYMPTVVFTREEVRAMPIDEVTASVRNRTSKYLGICFTHTNTIFINVRKFASLEDIKYTIVHELVHHRFPYLRHGKRFEKRLSLILKGKRYRPLHVRSTLTRNDAANGNNSNRDGVREK